MATTSSSKTSLRNVTIVGWEGDDDPENPQNWPARKKVLNGALVSIMAFLTPLSSSVLAPGVPQLMSEFGSSSPELASFVVSVYILGFAAGPLIMAPMSELYGRAIVYHLCNLGFLAFTVGTAVAPSLESLIVFRFFCGVFGSTPITNGGGTVADIVEPRKRGRALSAVIMGPMLGPVVGPIAGGFLADGAGWRWTSWLVTIVAGVVALLMLVLSEETFAPVLLKRKVQRLQKEASSPDIQFISSMDQGVSVKDHFKKAIARPLKLLILSPICTTFALYMAVVYGYLYIMFTSVTTVFKNEYDFASNIVGLVFLGMGVGAVLGLVLFSVLSDRYVGMKSKQEGGGPKPEYRLWLLPYAAICLPVALFIYGWTVEYKVHWIVPILTHVLM